MTITLTREEAQQVLDVMEGSIDAQEWEINDHITKYGEWFRPQRIEGMKKQLADTNSTIETLRARLSAPEPEPAKLLLIPALMEQAGWVRKREWQGLTDEEMSAAMDYWSDPVRSAYGGAHSADGEYVGMIDTWQYIEAKLKEKNT